MNQKGFTNIVWAVIIVILLGIVGYFTFVKKSETILKDETESWKTYSNIRYSYAIKYPSNWYVNTTYSENNFTRRGRLVEDNNVFIGGDTSFTNYPNPSSYDMENPAPKDFYSVNLMVYKIEPTETYDQFTSVHNYFEPKKKESISINGINALRLTGVSTDHPVGVTVVNTFVKVDGKMFVFNYSGNPIPQIENDIASKVIGSFTTK